MLILIGIFFGGLILFHILERVAPIYATSRSGPSRPGYFADFTASIINGPVLSSMAKIGAIYLVLWLPKLDTRGMSTWPWAAQFALFLLVNDFARYWLHRVYHKYDFLWRMHRVHHTVVEMDALSSFRVHLGETLIKYGVIVLPFYLLHVDRSVIILYGSIDLLKGFWHHANLRTRIGLLNYLLNSAELHWWHHSTESKGMQANFGSIFSIWDWAFGTLYYDKDHWPETIGVAGMEQFPQTYHEQFATVFCSEEQAKELYAKDAPEHAPAPCAPCPLDVGDALTST